MKKTYITPAVEIINSDCNQSILRASIKMGDDDMQHPTSTDGTGFVVGAKEGSSSWDDFDDDAEE